MRRVRREIEQLRIGHRHAFVYFVRILDHFRHVIVEACEESHFPRSLADGVEPLAHRFEGGFTRKIVAIGRKHDQMIGPKFLEERHGRLCIGHNLGPLRRVVRRTIKRDRNDLAPSL